MSLLSFFLLFALQAEASVKIHSVSNIQDGKIFLEMNDSSRTAYFLDLGSTVAKKIELPKEIGEEEIMGSLFLPGRLLLISQWTKGDGKLPHLWELDAKELKWGSKQEISCVSFDTIQAEENKLSFFCEDAAAKKLTLSFKVKKKMEWILPLTQGREGKYSYSLNGPLFSWSSIKIKSPLKKERILQADQIEPKK